MNKIVEYKKFICQNCGKEFEKPMRQVRRAEKIGSPIKYCSRECLNHSKKIAVKVTCTQCGKEFEKVPNKIGNINCCSKKCLDAYNLSNKTKFICKHCNKEFYVDNTYVEGQKNRNQNILYCSRECKHSDMQKNMINVSCDYCGKSYLKSKNKVGKQNFCNIECKNNYHKKYNRTTLTCKQCGKTFSRNNYKANIQHTKFCSMNCKKEYSGIIYDNYSKIAHYLRTSVAYDKWRNSVIARGKCEECNSTEDLQAHHKITLFNICEQYNFDKDKIIVSKEFNDIDNGICLCQSCHNKKHVFMKQKQYT